MGSHRFDESDIGVDVIVVGARVAGASTALLLARAGMRVMMIDRSEEGADTVSTHALMRPAVSLLARWGVLDEVVAAGTPAVRSTSFHYPDGRITVPIKAADGIDALYAPRRTVLDPILVDAARVAGVNVRFGLTATSLVRDERGRVSGVIARGPDGRPLVLSARFVVGADGARSSVARWVGAPRTHTGDSMMAYAYAHVPGVDDGGGYQWWFGADVAAGSIPTNHGSSCVFVGVPPRRFADELHHDVPTGFRLELARLTPDLAERIGSVWSRDPEGFRHRVFTGATGFLRRCWGPGWALVGDAGFFKDPCTAHGITDSLLGAELLARALRAHLGTADEDGALHEYERLRDELGVPILRISDRIASFACETDELRELHRSLSLAMARELAEIAGHRSAV